MGDYTKYNRLMVEHTVIHLGIQILIHMVMK